MKQILLCCFWGIWGWAPSLYAQSSEKLKELESKFLEQVSWQPQEKIFVHTDKSVYVTGEYIWFKTYCVDAAFHTPSSVSAVIYIELLDKQARPVIQERIHLREGMGNGRLFVHPEIASDVYVLRAYTSRMKKSVRRLFFRTGYFYC